MELEKPRPHGLNTLIGLWAATLFSSSAFPLLPLATLMRALSFIEVVVLIFLWYGYRWARTTILAFSAVGLFNLLIVPQKYLFPTIAPALMFSTVQMAVLLCSGLLSLWSLIYLNQESVRGYFQRSLGYSAIVGKWIETHVREVLYWLIACAMVGLVASFAAERYGGDDTVRSSAIGVVVLVFILSFLWGVQKRNNACRVTFIIIGLIQAIAFSRWLGGFVAKVGLIHSTGKAETARYIFGSFQAISNVILALYLLMKSVRSLFISTPRSSGRTRFIKIGLFGIALISVTFLSLGLAVKSLKALQGAAKDGFMSRSLQQISTGRKDRLEKEHGLRLPQDATLLNLEIKNGSLYLFLIPGSNAFTMHVLVLGSKDQPLGWPDFQRLTRSSIGNPKYVPGKLYDMTVDGSVVKAESFEFVGTLFGKKVVEHRVGGTFVLHRRICQFMTSVTLGNRFEPEKIPEFLSQLLASNKQPA